ncbi:MAG TPA: hypothetical protein VLE70_10335, partial [Anaerolineae bacterium]|nr:hypothetical protein [Anaerolineae bacterium]
MAQIVSRVKTNSAEYKANFTHNKELAKQLAERQHKVAFDRSQRLIDRQSARGKLLVRERIEAILDSGAPFLELSPLAGWG